MKAVQLEELLKSLPRKPGVYLFKDIQDHVLYIGKASNLNHRVRSYFSSPLSPSPKLQRLINKISDFEFIVTDSEQEALILECNLIKRYRPRYNIRLKDDKAFPYLKINLSEEWPRVSITRRLEEDGSRYFGPFASAGSVRQTLKLIKKIFPFRSCNKAITGNDNRPCLNYYIHRCLGPCIGVVTKEEYAEIINQVILFLEGKRELVLRELKRKMAAASSQFHFEKAALLRDQIQAVERVIEGQKIATTVKGEQDVIALAQTKDQAYVEIFFIRNSKLIGREHFLMEGIQEEKPSQIMASFIKQYYVSASFIPPLILLQYPVDDVAVITEWLKAKRERKVSLQVPKRGAKKQLVDMVAQNANQSLELAKVKQTAPESITSSLEELKRRLQLPQTPLRIECYDISNIQGSLAVGSMVVFDKGLPKPAQYRHFRIKTVVGANDYAMMQEVIRRRFKRSVSTEGTWSIIPDLILIDGGKGQLNATLEVLHQLEMKTIPTASLAKQREEVFLPNKSKPVDIPQGSPALHLLQRIRDEAHRFALGYHQRLRHKEGIMSILDSIPGIGPKRKKALLRKFGSIQTIKQASLDELTKTSGITLTLAHRIKESSEEIRP